MECKDMQRSSYIWGLVPSYAVLSRPLHSVCNSSHRVAVRGLTVHSSRTRFAARLNSRVKPCMKDSCEPEITFAAARALASNNCNQLSDDHLEAEHCWIFFSLNRGDWATAVSRHGRVSSVYDLRDDPQKMRDYLSMFSAYCSGNREVTDGLLQDFMRKYYPAGT